MAARHMQDIQRWRIGKDCVRRKPQSFYIANGATGWP